MVNPEFLPDHEEHEESSIQAHYEAFSIPKDNLIHIFSKETCPQDADFLTLKQQADKGDLYAQLRVGLCYEHGEGIKRSYESAFHYYQLAADKGHFDAQTALAKLYEQGLGIKQSDQQAFHYYRLAADQGHPGAQIKVGDFYERCRCSSASSKAVFRWV